MHSGKLLCVKPALHLRAAWLSPQGHHEAPTILFQGLCWVLLGVWFILLS